VPLFLRPPPVDVDRELAAMRAELSEIRASMRDGWLDEVRAEQVRAIVRDALADSSVRTSFSEAPRTSASTRRVPTSARTTA
jgi:hypothetical protein